MLPEVHGLEAPQAERPEVMMPRVKEERKIRVERRARRKSPRKKKNSMRMICSVLMMEKMP